MSKKKTLKKVFFILLISLVLIAVIVVTHIISVWHHINYGQLRQDARRVRQAPDPEWYIPLSSFSSPISSPNGNIRHLIWHGEIIFTDSDNKEILRTPLNLGSNIVANIVRYRNEYYVWSPLYDYMMRHATVVAEQRNRTYSLGEPILLRSGSTLQPVIVINSVEVKSTYDGELNTINFTINPPIYVIDSSATGFKRHRIFGYVEADVGIFGYIETDKGTIIDEFAFTDGGTVQVKLPAGEKINMIALRNPNRRSWGSADSIFFSHFVRKVALQ